MADVFLAAKAQMTYLPELHTEEETRRWMRDVVLREMEVWVARAEERVSGFAALSADLLEHLYVHPQDQNQGFGTALLEVAKERRPRGLRLWVFQKNADARRFYERNGFTLARLTDGRDNEERERMRSTSGHPSPPPPSRKRSASPLLRHRDLLSALDVCRTATPVDVAKFVVALVREGYARGTIRKTLQTLAMILDDAGVSPNPARDRHVRLPREEPEEINPPTAAHLEAVYRLLPSKHRLAFLFLDWSGARVSSIDLTLVSDYDEPRRRVRLRAATTKTRKPLWIELHPVLADALERQLGPREDRDPSARLFAGSGADALRTRLQRLPGGQRSLFSPHDLRHRRISLLRLRGVPWARIGEFVGQRNLSVTADVYSHVLGDETELDYAGLLV